MIIKDNNYKIKMYLCQSSVLKMTVLNTLQKMYGPYELLMCLNKLHPCCEFPTNRLLLMLSNNKLIDLPVELSNSIK